jgi:chaperonin cofactor prefoldin
MSAESDKEVTELRERVTRLEVKFEELVKRVDNISNYMKELYKYLREKSDRPSFL